MNIAFGLMMLLSITSFGFLNANGDGVEDFENCEKTTNHYTTGSLAHKKFITVLKLVTDLEKLVSKNEPFKNAIHRKEIRKQLADFDLDENAIEAMLTAGAIVITTTDQAIFLAKREFDNIIQDSFPVKKNEVLVLPGDSEEVVKYLETVSSCYEDELVRNEELVSLKIEQDKLEVLREKCRTLKRENRELDAKISVYSA